MHLNTLPTLSVANREIAMNSFAVLQRRNLRPKFKHSALQEPRYSIYGGFIWPMGSPLRRNPTSRHEVSPPLRTAELTTEIATSASQEDGFDWCAHWWPILPVCCLDKERPQGIMVLGVRYVVWWDKVGQDWRVFADQCPHRLAPLSEGRILPNGELMCSYHG